MYQQLGIIVLLLLIFSSCMNDLGGKLSPKPHAFGKANQVAVIADKQMWEGAVGDTFRHYFASPFLLLPQPEPIFDLKHFTPQDLDYDYIKKQLRTYIVLADLSNGDSPTSAIIRKDLGRSNVKLVNKDGKHKTIVGKDKWATGQLLAYIFANNESDLLDNIKANYVTLIHRIRESDQPQLKAKAFAAGDNVIVQNKLRKDLGIEMRLPDDYKIAIQDSSSVWMRKISDDYSVNILLSKVDYMDQAQLTKEGIKHLRDSIGKKYVSTTIKGTYMRTNDVDLPMFVNATTINNRYALEARGIWDIVNDYMGGPYLSYLIHNSETNELLFVDGFVHAPGKKKREHMQHIEQIFSTIEF